MGAHRYATAHMAHYQIKILIAFIRFACKTPGYGLLVESMKYRLARQFRHTAYSGIRYHLVDHHRIGYVSLYTDFIGNVTSYETTEIRGMLHTGVFEIVAQLIVYFIYTTFHRLNNTAAAYYSR